MNIAQYVSLGSLKDGMEKNITNSRLSDDKFKEAKYLHNVKELADLAYKTVMQELIGS